MNVTLFLKTFAFCSLFITFTVCFLPFSYFFLQVFSIALVLIIISWHFTCFLNHFLNRSYVSPENKAILITGCDSGFGFETAKKLDTYGFHVFAGCLDSSSTGAQTLREKCSNKLQILKLDVTSDSSINDAYDRIAASGLELWSLVNNAGICDGYFFEEGDDISTFRRVFDVNVFGVISLTKRFLPLLRQSNGRVVNISSVAGRITFNNLTAYSMSKAAIKSMSDGLRRELLDFRVKVICIEPSIYRTNIADEDTITGQIESNWKRTSEEVKSSYGESFKRKIKSRVFATMKLKSDKIYKVLNSIEHAITSREPDIYYLCCGAIQRPFLRLLFILPESVQDFVISGSLIKAFFKVMAVKNLASVRQRS